MSWLSGIFIVHAWAARVMEDLKRKLIAYILGGVHGHRGRVWSLLSGTGSDAQGVRLCCSMSCNIARIDNRERTEDGNDCTFQLLSVPFALLKLWCKTWDVFPFTSISLKSISCNFLRYSFPIFVTASHQVTQTIKSKSCRSQSCFTTDLFQLDFFYFKIRELLWMQSNYNVTWTRDGDDIVRRELRQCQFTLTIHPPGLHQDAPSHGAL